MRIKSLPKSIGFDDSLEINFQGNILNARFIKYEEDGKIIIIKLESGYDLAIPSKLVSGFKLLKKSEKWPLLKNEKEKPVSNQKPKLSIITTGGTISSKIDYKTGGVSPSVPPEYYFQIAPGLNKYGPIKIEPIMNVLSENMGPKEWIQIGKTAFKEIERGAAGVIVTMGTDTMHFASSAMSFMLNPLSVPIVFTGSQRSTDRGSSDANTNLLLSAITASKWDGGESVICMHADLNDDYNFILRGNRSRKMHTERRDAFRPINSQALGKVFQNEKIEKISEYIKKADKTVLNTKIDTSVDIVISYPGMKGGLIDYLVSKGSHGLVIAGTGFGNLPIAEKSLYDAIKNAGKRNIPIVVTSQAIYGSTNEFVYTTLRDMSKMENVIYVRDMTTETAFVKLMFALGKTKDMRKLKSMMLQQWAGEIGERVEIGEFLV